MLAQSIQSANCATKSLMGASTWPKVRVRPTPMGCTASSVPCSTETTLCSARAVAKLSKERCRPSST